MHHLPMVSVQGFVSDEKLSPTYAPMRDALIHPLRL
jgi:hypothetical protein